MDEYIWGKVQAQRCQHHPLLAPQFLSISPPTAALSSLTSLSSLSLPNPPFVAVYELLYTGYSDWVCYTSSMSISICQSCGIYTAGWEVTDDVALLGGYKYDCCMFLSNSDHQVLIQDLDIVCPWILKHSPICPRRQQELKYVSVLIIPNQTDLCPLSLNGHLYKTDTSLKRTPRVGPCLSLLSVFDYL